MIMLQTYNGINNGQEVKMFDKYIYNFLMWVNHWSTKLTSWSWCKLYSNRKKGYGYKKRKI